VGPAIPGSVRLPEEIRIKESQVPAPAPGIGKSPGKPDIETVQKVARANLMTIRRTGRVTPPF